MLMIMIIFIIFYYYYYQRQLLALFRLWGTLRGEQWSEKSCIEFPPTGGVRHLWSWQDFEFWVFFFCEWGYRNYDLNLSFGKNQMMFPPTGGVWSWRNFVFYNLIFGRYLNIWWYSKYTLRISNSLQGKYLCDDILIFNILVIIWLCKLCIVKKIAFFWWCVLFQEIREDLL